MLFVCDNGHGCTYTPGFYDRTKNFTDYAYFYEMQVGANECSHVPSRFTDSQCCPTKLKSVSTVRILRSWCEWLNRRATIRIPMLPVRKSRGRVFRVVDAQTGIVVVGIFDKINRLSVELDMGGGWYDWCAHFETRRIKIRTGPHKPVFHCSIRNR